jgi:hypothetical protein
MGNLEIQYELYNISIKSDNITIPDTQQTEKQNILQIQLLSTIKYLPIIITRYSNILPNQIIPLLDENICNKDLCNKDLSYDYMKNKYWLEKLNDTLEIDTARKNILKWLKKDTTKINHTYFLAPLYYSSNKLILGIIIIGKMELEINHLKTETEIFLANISSSTNEKLAFKEMKYKFNICLGIYNYYKKLENDLKKTRDKYKTTTHLDKLLISTNNNNNNSNNVITWKMVLMNCSNYLPKLELLIKEKKVTNFFQNHPNP